jgi:hypothetical protein
VPGGRRVYSRSCARSRSVPQSTAVSRAFDLWHVNPDRSLTAGPTLHESAGDQDGFQRELVGRKCERTLTVCQTPIPAGHNLNRWVRAFVHQPHFHSSSLVVPPHVALQADRPPMKVKFSWRPGGRLKVAFPTGRTAGGSIQDHLLHRFSEGRGHTRRILPTMVGGNEVPDRPGFEVDCSSELPIACLSFS